MDSTGFYGVLFESKARVHVLVRCVKFEFEVNGLSVIRGVFVEAGIIKKPRDDTKIYSRGTPREFQCGIQMHPAPRCGSILFSPIPRII